MFPYPLKTNLYPGDIITESIILIVSLVLLFSFHKLYSAYGRERMWLAFLSGIGFFAVGAALDLLDEFYMLPGMTIKIFGNSFMAFGVLLFAAGSLLIIKKLLIIAGTDPLTGLHNRHSLIDLSASELKRAKRYNLPLSIAFIDLINFKGIKDHLGHALGDAALKKVSENISQLIRASDTLARFGGDEFVLLIPHTDYGGAIALLQRLEESLARIEVSGVYKIGITYGIAVYPEDGDKIDDLINLADSRMYEKKRSIGNRNQYGPITLSE